MPTERIDIQVRERGAKVVKRNIAQIGTTAGTAGTGVNALKRALGFLAVGAVLRGTVNTLAEFSQAMSSVKAITQATGSEFDSLRDKAKDLGATTRFSATQAGEGMIFLARAGFEANEVLATIEGTLQLAQAGALDLASAADIASNVLQGFRLQVAETGRVVDVLALAANSSNTDIFQLGDALKFVAPIAAGVGLTIEETTAAVGALSNAGLQASSAGTGLRRVLSELESPASKTKKLFDSLGISADEVKISQVGLVGALQRLRDAGIDTGQALELFGDRGGPAFEVLSSSLPDVIAMEKALLNADGTAKRIAETMDDNLNGALFAAKSAFEAVVIAAGDLGAESFLTATFRNLADILRSVAKNMDEVTRAIGLMGAAFIALKLPVVIAKFQQLGFTLLFLLSNPIIALSAALIAIGAALFIFSDRIKVSSDGLTTLADVGVSAFELLKFGIAALRDFYVTVFTSIGDLADTIFGGMITKIKEIIDLGGGLLNLLKKIPGLGSVIEVGQLILEGAKVRAELRNQQDIIKKLEADAAGRQVPAPGPGAPDPTAPGGQTLASVLRDLEEQGKLLRLNNQEREIQNNLRKIEAKLEGTLLPIEKALVVEKLKELQLLQDRANLLDEIRGPQEDFLRQQAALNALLADGAINAQEFANKMREMRLAVLQNSTDLASGIERGLLSIKEEFTNVAILAENAFTNAFQGAEDALLKFVTTGKLEIGNLANSIIQDLTRIAIRQSITGPLASFLGGGAGGTKDGGLGFGGILKGIGGLLGGFQNGGSFTVGGRGGIDNNLVAFNATRGEEVRVTPRGAGGGGNVTVQMTIVTPDADSFRRSEGQIGARAAAVIQRAQTRNG